jgi:hypothetical protein
MVSPHRGWKCCRAESPLAIRIALAAFFAEKLARPIAILPNFIYKLSVLLALPTITFKCPMRRFLMKKLFCVVSVLMMSLVVVGCGNSADGDKQKIEAPAAPSL